MVTLTSNEEKVRKKLEKFPQGVKASMLVKELYVSKTPLYDALNRLENNDLAFRGEHNLWYPQQPSKTNSKSDIAHDIEALKEAYDHRQIDTAFRIFVRLRASNNKLQKDWILRSRNVTQLNNEMKIIEGYSSPQSRAITAAPWTKRGQKISELKSKIVFEALKHWT